MNRYREKLDCMIDMGARLRKLSTCKRQQTSAIIFTTDCTHIHAIGYNGVPSGVPNDACTEVEGTCGCVHAEINAIAKLDRHIMEPCLLYTLTAPCIRCASLVVNTRCIVGVIYNRPYRTPYGLELILKHGIPAMHVNELNFPEHSCAVQEWKQNDSIRQRR